MNHSKTAVLDNEIAELTSDETEAVGGAVLAALAAPLIVGFVIYQIITY